MVIDGAEVITGSFHFTKSAEENNAENLLVVQDRKLADRHVKNWEDQARHSEVFGRRK
jgi:phosphatidylserine/phosphatidylglycerophosphate/cardiolipin synthase-like enzyme